MIVDEKIYKNKQILNLNLYNNKGVEDNIRIVVHKNNLKGDIVYLSDWITIEDNSIVLNSLMDNHKEIQNVNPYLNVLNAAIGLTV